MSRLISAFAACSLVLAATGAAAATPSPRYDGAVITGTPAYNAGFFQIDTTTGKTWQAWGGALQGAAVVDNAPVPPGQYKLMPSYYVAPDNKVTWNLYRLDAVSGRSWVALGGGAAPLVWTEMTPPK